MLKIQRSQTGATIVFSLSGRVEPDDVAELERLFGLESAGQAIVLDLQDLTLVDRETLRFLVRCQGKDIRLDNCPAYILEWIETERGRGGKQ